MSAAEDAMILHPETPEQIAYDAQFVAPIIGQLRVVAAEIETLVPGLMGPLTMLIVLDRRLHDAIDYRPLSGPVS